MSITRAQSSASTSYNDNGEVIKKKRLEPYEYISDVRVYNRLLAEFAKTGKTSRVTYLFKAMRLCASEKAVQPNLSSYAAVLQSLGYELTEKSSTKTTAPASKARLRLLVERVLHDMHKAELSESALSEAKIDYKQAENIEAAVRLILPEFRCKIKDPSEVRSNNPLTSDLDKLTSLKSPEDKHFTPSLDKKYLLASFEKQLELEKNILIQVHLSRSCCSGKAKTSFFDFVLCNKVPSVQKFTDEKKNTLANREKMRVKLLADFRENVTKHFLKSLAYLEESKRGDDAYLVPFLTVMEKSDYIEILLKHVVKLAQLSQYYSPTVAFFANDLGKSIESKYHEFCKV